MNVLKLIRSSEWWEYKLPPLLALGYATTVQFNKNIYDAALWIGFLLLSIVVGAVYVSIVNDVTDVEDDRASGKHNRLSNFKPRKRWVLLTLSILPGIACAYFFSDDALMLSLYAASYLAFSLYSLPPFRLKKRGFAGVLADACGAHVFPSLLMVAGTVYFFKLPMNWMWFTATGVWAFMYGLRGILWHQFADRENDLAIGLKTFATRKDPSSFGKLSSLILSVELVSLVMMLGITARLWPVVVLLAYLLLAAYYKKIGLKLIAIVPPADQPWHILMGSYYQALLPISLLIEGALQYPTAWIVLAIHILLFPQSLKHIVLDAVAMVRAVVSI